MLIIALVLAVVGLAALVTAVVTSNELIAWVCIVASLVGVILLIVDAVRERSGRTRKPADPDRDDDADADAEDFDAEYPDDAVATERTDRDPDEAAVPVDRDDEAVGDDRR